MDNCLNADLACLILMGPDQAPHPTERYSIHKNARAIYLASSLD